MKTHKVRYKVLSLLSLLASCAVVSLGKTEGGIFLMLGAIYCRFASWEEEKPRVKR
jgi:hypothetical protein